MTVSGHVVGLWATLNLVLALGLIAYDGSPFVIGLHVAAVVLVAGFGLAVRGAARRGAVGPQLRQPYRSLAAASAGTTAFVIAWGAAYGTWLWILAIYPVIVTILLVGRERLPRQAGEASPDQLARPREVPVERPPDPATARRRGLEIAHRRRRRRRGEAT